MGNFGFFECFLGGIRGGRNWKRIFEKTRVGFGRTEVSVRLDGIVFCALSFGHGPRGRGFEGVWKRVDFHVFVGGRYWGVKRDTIGNFKMKKLGSGLVVRKSPQLGTYFCKPFFIDV